MTMSTDTAPQPSTSTTAIKGIALTSAERFWYTLSCIFFGAGYFRKVPVKKALQDAGVMQMTSAESFWYTLSCICLGSGYFSKVPVKKALSDIA